MRRAMGVFPGVGVDSAPRLGRDIGIPIDKEHPLNPMRERPASQEPTPKTQKPPKDNPVNKILYYRHEDEMAKSPAAGTAWRAFTQ